MDNNYHDIAELLLSCEEKGYAPKYVVCPDTYKKQNTGLFKKFEPVRTEPVKYNTDASEIFVVSDLHIASGRDKAGVYKGTENFFADDAFFRFIEFAQNSNDTKKKLLIINGDIFDFLRITDYPGKVKKARPVKKMKSFLKFRPVPKDKKPGEYEINCEYLEWLNALEKTGIKKTRRELEDSISEKEQTYGLHTDDYKSIYKLMKIRQGHPAFFQSLSFWLRHGNKIIILKGNHDLELYWAAVRNYLRLILAEEMDHQGHSLIDILKTIVLPNITFIDDSIEIDKDFYLEHGHRYDKFSMVLDNPVLKKRNSEINIPFGSFINRYLLNMVELFLPFLDNVKPTLNILPLLIKENFPLAIKVLFQHIPLTIRILSTNIRYTWFMFNRIFWFFLALVAPLIFIIVFHGNSITAFLGDISKAKESSGYISALIQQAQNIVFLIFSYFLSRLVAWFQIEEPSTLDSYAEQIFNSSSYKIITMGHTHNPGEYTFTADRHFYNTGTWIPIIEISNAEVREDRTYMFLHLIKDHEGKIVPGNQGLLQRWNDSAGRAEPLVLIEKK